MFKLIACINKKNCIGENGRLLYHIGNDLSNFKKMTINNVVIMGRKTFESLPNGPLPNRYNIILTTDEEYYVDSAFSNVYICYSIEEVKSLCESFFSEKELFVIGGRQIYEAFLKEGLIEEMRLTIVNDDYEGDTYFPEINTDDWFEYYKSMAQVSSYNGIDKSFYFQILKRKENG